jgi:UDP-glucose 4-epimerase
LPTPAGCGLFSNAGKSSAFNLPNARGYSVKEVIETAERICNRTVPVNIAARRHGDPPMLVGSAEWAWEVLGWRPDRSGLDVQIEDAWNWLMDRNS